LAQAKTGLSGIPPEADRRDPTLRSPSWRANGMTSGITSHHVANSDSPWSPYESTIKASQKKRAEFAFLKIRPFQIMSVYPSSMHNRKILKIMLALNTTRRACSAHGRMTRMSRMIFAIKEET
jgi:hypothetical protein